MAKSLSQDREESAHQKQGSSRRRAKKEISIQVDQTADSRSEEIEIIQKKVAIRDVAISSWVSKLKVQDSVILEGTNAEMEPAQALQMPPAPNSTSFLLGSVINSY